MNPLKIVKLVVLFCLPIFSSTSYAVTCTANSVSVHVDPIKISHSTTAGDTVWVSNSQTVSVTCSDTDHMPQGEAARIYIDPDHEFAHFLQGTNMKLVVSIDGRSYDQSAQAVTTQYQATLPRTGSNGYCNSNSHRNTSACLALPQTFSFTFNLSLVATGKLPDPLPALAGRTINKVFVVDGIGSINSCSTHCSASNPAKNFGPALTGLNNISYINCEPIVLIASDKGTDTVEFGRISITEAKAGKDNSHSKQFAVIAAETAGKHECRGINYAITFTGTTHNSGTVFTGQGTPDIGVTLQDAARPSAGDIISGNRIDFTSGAFNNQSDSRRKEFMATLFWLKNPPQPGAFSIPVNATVTFK
ncbi:TPA: fimbrial protein [Citrobacter freundii]|uniref:fimbrial protein n=1 Tax=Citrobacter freundii TaxID=546 RepID=UPI00186BB1A4|nr:fimbrial protein [Citrobacter freundii]MBE4703325.1 fimbrial protein [Citrobacter freundii]